jgi:Pretoxin HINT domain
VPIEQVEIGDEVWAADPETGQAGARPVTALIEGEGVKDLVTVSTGSGSVVATAGHPFWSVADAAWVDAGDLSVGDAVLQADGATSVVTEVVEVSRPAVVHNLTVADLHTYFVVVGDAPTLVHNCSGSASPFSFQPSHAISGRPSTNKVNEIADLMRSGEWDGPAIKVVELNGQRIVVDGHHRLAAAKRAGVDIDFQVVDPESVFGRGGWRSIEDILNAWATAGPNRLGR